MRDKLETGTDCYIDPKFFFDHSSTSFSSWLGCSSVGHWGPKVLCLQLGLTSLASCLRLTRSAPSTWLYYCLTSTCFHCSSTYLHRWISWLTARSRVNIYIYIYIYIYKEHTISFQTYFVWALLLRVQTWNSSPLRSNLRLQCTCCTFPTTSGRPHRTLSLCLWDIAVDPAFIAGHQSIKNCGIWIGQLDHLPAAMITSFFRIFSEHPWDKLAKIFCIFSSSWIIVCTVPPLTSNCALIVSIDTRRSLSTKFFIWPTNSGVLTSLLLPHLSSPLTDSLPSLNLLCHSKTHARFMQNGRKAVWSIPYVSVAFFSKFKTEFYCISFF